MIITH